ncbi:MarR family transcriptional regulator [Salinisphaera dokdonensis CL-ES53]|uniref:MarR family transcriptional regulator n=1 Tax=Salinisphaera dokdonensis CL-ES53 TaxID=1304272 RepID=A0ABV2B2X8_9GAMM
MNSEQPRPRGCTNFKLRQLGRVVARHYDDYLGQAGLKGTQYSLLSQVVTAGPLRAGELARVMRLDNSTLTRTLDTLERQGWIVRRVGEDGRSRVIEATDAGIARRDEAKRCWKQAQQSLNARIGEAEVVRLHQLLDELTEALEDDPDQDDVEDAAASRAS